MANYDGLTRNTWPGTWSPSADHPIVLDTEVRGGLRYISGNSGDQLTDITGQRLQEGMLVYVANSYGDIEGGRYYRYELLSGEVRNSSTGAMPNGDSNWSEFTTSSLDLASVQAVVDSDYVLDRSTNYIQQQIDALVDAAPGALDTLNELAAAINDDSNFAGTITESIATKLAINDFETYFDSHFTLKSTTDLSEGTNLYYTRNRFDSDLEERLGAIDFDIIPDADSTRSLGSADKRFKDLWLSGETLILGNLSISDGGSGTLNISEIDSYGNVTSAIGALSAKNLDNAINLDLDSIGQQVVDTYGITQYRTARYIIQIEHDSTSKYHSTEILLMHNNTEVYMTEYAVLRTDSSLGEITADIDNGNIRLLMTPSFTNTSIKAKRLIIDA